MEALCKHQLHRMEIPHTHISILRSKEGVTVARVYGDSTQYILKYFERQDFCREIENYKILSTLGIPTLKIQATTHQALLMEDLDCHLHDRLGKKEDLYNPLVVTQIGKWYRNLHQQGYAYVKQQGQNLYDEGDLLTEKTMSMLSQQAHTKNSPVWEVLLKHGEEIRKINNSMAKTITYHDFNHTNLVVAKDFSVAWMYDYNLMGKGYAYTDVRNVCSMLEEESRDIFLMEYGDVDPREVALDEVISPIVGLYFACQRSTFPQWAEEILHTLDATYLDKLEKLLQENR